MTFKEKGIRALTRGFPGRIRNESICLSCRRTLQLHRRHYASAAAVAEPSADTSSDPPPPSERNPKSNATPKPPRPAFQLQAGVVLSRPAFLTRAQTPFEKAFYLYQRRLNERLALPFTRYFYFKKGTPAELEWKAKIKRRLTPARDIGVYNAYGATAWNDELLVGDRTSEPENQMEMLLRDAETVDAEVGVGAPPDIGSEQTEKAKAAALLEQKAGTREVVERPMARESQADRTGDQTSLDRLGWRSLYLLVKGKGGKWTFPSARLVKNETLQQAAERIIVQAGGPNMNTWVVGNGPIGHYVAEFPSPVDNAEKGTKELGEKTFFMKGRIMAGQANLSANKLGLEEFKWLTKEEVQAHVTPKYWSMTADMLVDR